MSASIPHISAAALDPEVLRRRIYPDLGHTLYWSDDWSPRLYMALARAGFISISHRDPRGDGSLLLPELQKSYAVLDWSELHLSRHVRKLLDSGRVESELEDLEITAPGPELIEGLLRHHGPRCWLSRDYRDLVARLPGQEGPGFAIRGIGLRSRREGELIAGELGYTIGRTYTSLTGFFRRDDPRWRHFGTLQLVLLARRLRECGYAFWNLGHPHLAYKRALGANVLSRETFLQRWLEATREPPQAPLSTV
ncbi:MAG TPA: GNAT family N-acetyltransferase [Myxococcota bacterium]|nr:GNAT family N-acetyltransferase [Myxococcota bacterium]